MALNGASDFEVPLVALKVLVCLYQGPVVDGIVVASESLVINANHGGI